MLSAQCKPTAVMANLAENRQHPGANFRDESQSDSGKAQIKMEKEVSVAHPIPARPLQPAKPAAKWYRFQNNTPSPYNSPRCAALTDCSPSLHPHRKTKDPCKIVLAAKPGEIE
jgi:hypothetical protein